MFHAIRNCCHCGIAHGQEDEHNCMLLTVRNVWASDLEGDFCQFLFELFGEVILENKEGKEIPHTCIIIMTHVNREKYLNEYTF